MHFKEVVKKIIQTYTDMKGSTGYFSWSHEMTELYANDIGSQGKAEAEFRVDCLQALAGHDSRVASVLLARIQARLNSTDERGYSKQSREVIEANMEDLKSSLKKPYLTDVVSRRFSLQKPYLSDIVSRRYSLQKPYLNDIACGRFQLFPRCSPTAAALGDVSDVDGSTLVMSMMPVLMLFDCLLTAATGLSESTGLSGMVFPFTCVGLYALASCKANCYFEQSGWSDKLIQQAKDCRQSVEDVVMSSKGVSTREWMTFFLVAGKGVATSLLFSLAVLPGQLAKSLEANTAWPLPPSVGEGKMACD